MSDLKYHKDDNLQEYDKRTEQLRNEYFEKEEKKQFSIKGQILTLFLGISFILEGFLSVIRDGLFNAPALIGEIPNIILICMGCIFVFFSLRLMLRKKKS